MWSHVRYFMRQVDRRTFELGGESEASLRQRFFPGRQPGGEVGQVVDKALSKLVDENPPDWEGAGDLLVESFAQQSICAQELPVYEVESEHTDGEHLAACHLHKGGDEVIAADTTDVDVELDDD
jgi:hypothetical protein